MESRYPNIARQVLADIEAGVFKPGDRLPKRSELAKRFGVARATVDRAIRGLVENGVLESRRGSGTAVASDKIVYRLALLGAPSRATFHQQISNVCQIEPIAYQSIIKKSQRASLLDFDGIVWYCPDELQLTWAREFSGKLPQIILNRHLDDFNYVSTDHRGALHQITARRLAQAPNACPFFLLDDSTCESLVWKMRLEGFTDACREAGRYHEFLATPSDFEGKMSAIENRLVTIKNRPLVIVSGTRQNTGAVVAWARSKGLVWKKDLLYSDFDNDFTRDVLGVEVTSFIQDYPSMVITGIQKLLDMIKGVTEKTQILVSPTFIEGET